ncbi:MAG: twin-arginine translocase subunit TatC [Zetaproteobacteria bacterium]|nr:twin-arginine translocase subunit TatC [Zetaproteobacteria bacterium]
MRESTSQPLVSPLTEHLRELRSRLTRSVVSLLLCFIACYLLSDALVNMVVAPLRASLGPNMPMIFINLPEVFFAHVKVAFVSALFLTSPYILYHLWSFVAPGLYRNERRLFVVFLVGSSVLFLAGGYFAYSIVMPLAFQFFLGFSAPDLQAFPAMQQYISLVLSLGVAFGIAFEVPMVCILLVKLGAVTIEKMKKQRRWVLVGSFVLGAVLTPPDVISQVLLAIPVYLLFELGLLVASWMQVSPIEENSPAA